MVGGFGGCPKHAYVRSLLLLIASAFLVLHVCEDVCEGFDLECRCHRVLSLISGVWSNESNYHICREHDETTRDMKD